MESMEQDDRIGLVESYLEMLLPKNWNEMDLFNRRSFISTKDDPLMPKGTERREFVSNAEIWAECFGKPLGELRPSDSYAISGIMGRISGWKKTKDRKRIPIYGQQRVYHRDREE